MPLNFGFSEHTLSTIIKEARAALPSPDTEHKILESLTAILNTWRMENEDQPTVKNISGFFLYHQFRISNVDLAIKLWFEKYGPLEECVSLYGHIPFLSAVLINACQHQYSADIDKIFEAYRLFVCFKNIEETHREASQIASDLLKKSQILDRYSELLKKKAETEKNRAIARTKGTEANKLKAQQNKDIALKINQDLFKSSDFSTKFRTIYDRAKYIKKWMDEHKKTQVNGKPYSIATIQGWIKGIEPASS